MCQVEGPTWRLHSEEVWLWGGDGGVGGHRGRSSWLLVTGEGAGGGGLSAGSGVAGWTVLGLRRKMAVASAAPHPSFHCCRETS